MGGSVAMNKRNKVKTIVCLVVGTIALAYCVATLASLTGTVSMMLPSGEYDPIALARSMLHLAWGTLALGFLSGILLYWGISGISASFKKRN
jgi:hypothetical protein